MKLKLISTNIHHCERKMELAELQISSLNQEQSMQEDLRVAIVKSNEAWFAADEAFWTLIIAFPKNEAIERPAALEEQGRYVYI